MLVPQGAVREGDGAAARQVTHVDAQPPARAGREGEQLAVGRQRGVDLEARLRRDADDEAESELGRSTPPKDQRADSQPDEERSGYQPQEGQQPSSHTPVRPSARPPVRPSLRSGQALSAHDRRHSLGLRRDRDRLRLRSRRGTLDRVALDPESLSQRQHLAIRRGVQLLLNERLVDPDMLQGGRPVTRGDERFHEPDRHPRVERVLGAELPPPLDGPQPVGAVGRAPASCSSAVQ